MSEMTLEQVREALAIYSDDLKQPALDLIYDCVAAIDAHLTAQAVLTDEVIDRARNAYKAIKRYHTADYPEPIGSIRSVVDINRNDDAAWRAALESARLAQPVVDVAALDDVPTVGFVGLLVRDSDGADCEVKFVHGAELNYEDHHTDSETGFHWEFKACIGRDKAKALLSQRQPQGAQGEEVVCELAGHVKDGEDGPYIDWLGEGGMSELPDGTPLWLLSGADFPVEDGMASLYTHPAERAAVPEGSLLIDVRGKWYDVPIPVHLHIIALRDKVEQVETVETLVAVYDAVSRSNLTRDVKTRETKTQVVRDAMLSAAPTLAGKEKG